MPQIRERQSRERNANVNLRLVLSETEAKHLAETFPDAKSMSEAATKAAMAGLNTFFTSKKVK